MYNVEIFIWRFSFGGDVDDFIFCSVILFQSWIVDGFKVQIFKQRSVHGFLVLNLFNFFDGGVKKTVS